MAVKYYTVAFRDIGSPRTGLSAIIDTFRNLATGGALAAPSVTEIAGGIYRFGIDWDIAPYVGVDQIALRVDSQDSGMSDADRYIFGLIQRHDANDNYTISNTISTTVSAIDLDLNTLSDLMDAMVLGDWTIEDNQLKIYKENGTQIKVFDLFDINGDPTNTSATSRVGV